MVPSLRPGRASWLTSGGSTATSSRSWTRSPRTTRRTSVQLCVSVTGSRVAGWIVLRRGKGSAAPHPTALIPPTPIEDRVLRDAIRRVADSVAERSMEGPGDYRAIRDLLLLAPPRSEDSYLAIQGPPGTGKTTLGAEMIVDRLVSGRRVGITAMSHKVIGNLLDAVCREAERRGYAVRAMQKADEDQRCRS